MQIQYKDRLLNGQWIPVFAPDGTKVAFVAERPSGNHAVGVASVPAAAGEALPVQWEPEFDAVDRPVWEPDSSAPAYAAGRSKAEWVVIKRGEVVASFADITHLAFAPDGALAFWASDGRKQFVVLGSERQPAFDEATAPTFSPDGTLVYTASDAGRHFVMEGSSALDSRGKWPDRSRLKQSPAAPTDRGGRFQRLTVNSSQSPSGSLKVPCRRRS